MKTIAIAGTFDSKGEEFLYVKKLVEKLGLQTYMIHTGVFEPAFEPDVSNREVAEAAGYDIDKIVESSFWFVAGHVFVVLCSLIYIHGALILLII